MKTKLSNLLLPLAGLLGSIGGFGGGFAELPPALRGKRRASGILSRSVGRWGKSPNPGPRANSRIRTKKGAPQPTWRDAHAKATNQTAREVKRIVGRADGQTAKALRLARSERRKAGRT